MLSLLIATILRPSLRVEVARLSILGVGAITDNRLKSRVGDAGQVLLLVNLLVCGYSGIVSMTRLAHLAA